LSAFFGVACGADAPLFFSPNQRYPTWEVWLLSARIVGLGFPTARRFSKRSRRKIFALHVDDNGGGFDKIIHYLEKKRELEALESELKKQEGFKVESED